MLCELDCTFNFCREFQIAKMLCSTPYVLLVGLFLAIPEVEGHGRLVEPPSRASMWRFGYDNPPNYSDSGLFCGGSSVSCCRCY